MSNEIVTRFAPSPSGELHLGNARTLLFNDLMARAHGGRRVLRIEDTDSARSQDAHVQALLEDLAWLGLEWEEGPDRGGPQAPYRQSQRGAVYQRYFQALEQRDLAYPCFCTPLELELSRRAQRAAGRPPRYAGTCRDLDTAARAGRIAAGATPSLRFRVPAGRRVQFEDFVHGLQGAGSEDIGDFIIRREDGTAAFFFCNAIDDALMGVTHVLRGDDHLSNTPRQLLVLEALGLPVPQYGHVSLLLGADGAPLSKRNGSQSVRELRAQGHAPEAICNLLFRLGHSTPVNTLLSLQEMARAFHVTHLQRSPAHFDAAQLLHWQREWVHALAPEAMRRWLAPTLRAGQSADQSAGGADELDAFLAAVRPNIVLAQDARAWQRIVYEDPVVLEPSAAAAVAAAGPQFFAAAAAAAASADTAGARPDLGTLRTATGRKGAEFFQPLRAALTGQLHGPELAPLLALMPAARVRARLQRFASPDSGAQKS